MTRSVIAVLALGALGCGAERAAPPDDTAAGAPLAAAEPGPCGPQAPLPPPGDSLRARVVVVTQGQRGMIARARWALSPDGCALLAVEDWASIENEPFGDGVVLAREGSGVVQKDGVWDAVPGPDWIRLAYGKAHRVSAGERDSLTSAQWDSLARAVGIPVADVRRGAFPASGMAIMVGLAQPGIVRLGCAGSPGCDRVFPIAAGWRVGWSADGTTLAAAAAPSPMVSDDAEPTRWLALDPETGTPRGELPPEARLAPVRWTDGPTIDVSVSPDTIHAPRIAVDGGSVETADGVVRLGGRVVGPGIALAATRSGHYILALAPRPDAKEYEATHRLVVYALDR